MSNGINAPYGASIVQSQIGNGGTQKLGQYLIAASPDGQTTLDKSIFQGDIVTYAKLGNAFATSTLNGTIVPILTPNAGSPATQVGGEPVGIFMGCIFIDALTGFEVNSDYWPASQQVRAGTPVIAFVNDDPEVVFKIQISTSTNNAVNAQQNNIAPSIFQYIFSGQNIQLGVGGTAFTAPIGAIPANNPATGNSRTGQSAYYIDGSTINFANGAGGNPAFLIKIIGLVPEIQTLPNPKGLVQGVDMPFIDVLCKFNNHIYGSLGTPGRFFAA
jgi:hypothetical protein